ncbi:c-type cytochrome [Acidisoma sp.]|uniref:c-type cytochrome n=1 Tax=Acidisoma sp. TaxID=1872115 RepID=UPI003B00B527
MLFTPVRLFGLALLVVLLGAGGFFAWASQPAIDAAPPPPPSAFSKATVAKGALIASTGYCAECHTAPGGAPFAGGYPVATPFGTIYGSNITPDMQTGIGSWSEAAFRRAMHRGIARNGEHLYPAFPYNHFTLVSDDDVAALYAYLMTRAPANHRVPAPQLPFPLNIRLVLAGWNLLFLHEGRFQPEPKQSAAWNRGAYIAEGLGHCAACHTPHNAFGAEIASAQYAGGHSDGWLAPALNHGSPAPAPWTEDELATYFGNGFVQNHGLAAGPMQNVTENLQRLPRSDLDALATYIGSFEPPPSPGKTAEAVAAADRVAYRPATAQQMSLQGPATSGEAIYAGACASCHFLGGNQPFYRPVTSGLSSVTHAPDPDNFIQIVLHGVQPPPGAEERWMPPFAGVLTPSQIVLLAQYVRHHFTDEPAWTKVGDAVARIEKEAQR